MQFQADIFSIVLKPTGGTLPFVNVKYWIKASSRKLSVENHFIFALYIIVNVFLIDSRIELGHFHSFPK